jgi:hypothetical protein
MTKLTLLGNLLCLDCLGELLAERQVLRIVISSRSNDTMES